MAAGEGDARDLAECVNTGVGSSGAMHRDRPTLESRQRRFQKALHRLTVGLPLPADEAGAVVGRVSLSVRMVDRSNCRPEAVSEAPLA